MAQTKCQPCKAGMNYRGKNMRHWEETVEMIKQVITHAKEHEVDYLTVEFDHYIPSPKMGYPRVKLVAQFPQHRGDRVTYEGEEKEPDLGFEIRG
jgi:hypothetical protein